MTNGSLPAYTHDPTDLVTLVISRRWPTLTPREREIVYNLTKGRSTAEISGRLFLSRSAVKFHVTNLLRKTGVRSTRQLLALVIDSLARASYS